jgi:hypothetical protein
MGVPRRVGILALVVASVPAIAVAVGYTIFVVWNQLIRAEILPNTTLEWFPSVAVIWGCLCVIGGAILLRSKAPSGKVTSRIKRKARITQ